MNKTSQFLSLDILRGIAAILVATYHCGWLNFGKTIGVVANAGLMVDLFFVLSGFVIFLNYHEKLFDVAGILLFMRKRFWRLWPLHFALLLVFLIIEMLRYGYEVAQQAPLDPAAFSNNYVFSFVCNIFLVHSLGLFHNLAKFNAVSWSISVEFYTYFLYGLLCWFGRWRFLLVFFVIVASAYVLLFYHGRLTSNSDVFGFYRCAYSFGIGFLACRVYMVLQSYVGGGLRNFLYTLSALLIVLLSVWLIGEVGKTRSEIFVPPIFGFVILLLSLSERKGDFEISIFKPLIWLGKVSYSIYMVHLAINWIFVQFFRVVFKWPIVINAFGQEKLDGGTMHGNLAFLLYLAVVLWISAISFRLIEDKYRRGFGRGRLGVVAFPRP